MSTTQLLLVIVVPIVVSIIANLLTDPVKNFGAKVSSNYREKRLRKEAQRIDLYQSLAANDALATQYLLVGWVGFIGLTVVAVVIIVAALLVPSDLALVFMVLAGSVQYYATRTRRRLSQNYEAYLRESGAADSVITAIVGKPNRRGKRPGL